MDNNEWETDPKTGKRFRRVGQIIEHEMEIHTNGFVVPQSELAEFHKQRKAAEKKRREEAQQKTAEEAAKPNYSCPFSNSMNNRCRREECALFLDGRCSFAIIADAHATDQPIAKGAKCPFSVYGRCESCALNNGGCAIVRLAAGIKK